MRLVTNKKKEITIEEVIKSIGFGLQLTICYKAKSERPYFLFLKKPSYDIYGFQSNLGLDGDYTYQSSSIAETLKLAIGEGREILVFNRNQQNELFRL